MISLFEDDQKGIDSEVCIARITRPHHGALKTGLAAEARVFPGSESDGSKPIVQRSRFQSRSGLRGVVWSD